MSLFGRRPRIIVSPTANYNNELFTASQGQTVFTLTNGTYEPGVSLVKVYVNGLLQVSGTNFTETSSSSITLSEGVDVGSDVLVEWYG
jgi:hypothetical protein